MQQFADSYYNMVFFIDSNGNKCHYNLTKETMDYAELQQLYEYLCDHIDDYEKKPFLNGRDLERCYKFLYLIDPNAETDEEPNIRGEEVAIYGIRQSQNEDMEFILLKGKGRMIGTNTDESAKEVMGIIEKNEGVDIVNELYLEFYSYE